MVSPNSLDHVIMSVHRLVTTRSIVLPDSSNTVAAGQYRTTRDGFPYKVVADNEDDT